MAAHSSSDRIGQIPAELPAHCRAELPALTALGFLSETAEDHYRITETVRHLSGLHPRSGNAALVLDQARWEAWKAAASPALRRHAEAVEHCPICAIPTVHVVAAFMLQRPPVGYIGHRVRSAYAAWKGTQPDRGPQAAAFAAEFRAAHGHGPSVKQLFDGLGWQVPDRQARCYIVSRLLVNQHLTNTAPVPWTLRPASAVLPCSGPPVAAAFSATGR